MASGGEEGYWGFELLCAEEYDILCPSVDSYLALVWEAERCSECETVGKKY